MLFWMKNKFTIDDIETTVLYPNKDASHIAEAKGGSHAARLEREKMAKDARDQTEGSSLHHSPFQK
jgi:hypothetical protein